MLSRCPGCGLELEALEGPCDPYRGASPACWSFYGEVLAREYQEPRAFSVNQWIVNAYMAQHPSRVSRAAIQSVWVHLAALCLTLEREASPAQVARAMTAIAAPKREFEWLAPPTNPGEVNVAALQATSDLEADFEARLYVAHEWAKCVWASWELHQPRIRALVDALPLP